MHITLFHIVLEKESQQERNGAEAKATEGKRSFSRNLVLSPTCWRNMAAKGEEKLRAAAAVAIPTAAGKAEGTIRRRMARAANIRISQ
jgi:hypothetical protein